MTADLAAPQTRPTCPVCGQNMPPLNRDGQPRTYCGRVCSRKGEGKPKVRDMYADEAEHLLSFGTPVATVCKALGVAPGALARAMRRERRPELACPFERYERTLRREQARAA